MTEEVNQNPEPEKKSFLDRLKEMADKAEDFIEDTTEKVKESEAFKKAGEFLDKAEDYVEGKVDELEKSGIKEKVKDFSSKMGDKAEDLLEKARVLGKSIVEKTADKRDDVVSKDSGPETAAGTVTPPIEPGDKTPEAPAPDKAKEQTEQGI